jgi:hypothetical protein
MQPGNALSNTTTKQTFDKSSKIAPDRKSLYYSRPAYISTAGDRGDVQQSLSAALAPFPSVRAIASRLTMNLGGDRSKNCG